MHFSADVVEAQNAEISLNYVSRDRVDIHLGFLKVDHRYRITFSVKDDLGDKVTADKNENIAIYESVPNEEGICQFCQHCWLSLVYWSFLKSPKTSFCYMTQTP